MSDLLQTPPRDKTEVYPVAKFILAYIAALGLTFTFMALGLALIDPSDASASSEFILSFLFFYIIVGMALTRFIFRRVLWHKFQVSLAEVANKKVNTWIFWPVKIPFLILQIIIATKF